MQIHNNPLASEFIRKNNDAANTSETRSEQNFLHNLLDLAQSKSNNISQVPASGSKELNFWTSKEESPGKFSKLRTIDDVMAEIEKIVGDIKKQK